MFVTRDELRLFEPGSLFVDVSCDEGMGFEWARPTSFAELQGMGPRWMHLALGHGELASFKVSDYAAYERQTRRRLKAVTGAEAPADLYPEPVEHCAICRWSEACQERRHRDDDLSLMPRRCPGRLRPHPPHAQRARFRGRGSLED